MSFQTQINDLLSALRHQGWAVADGLIPTETCENLLAQLLFHKNENTMKKAAIGHGPAQQIKADVRGDSILWIDEKAPRENEKSFLNWMSELRAALNQELFLGLESLETHYACYPPGAGYDKHLDCFSGTSERVLSFVLYLNKDWEPDWGGELVVYEENYPVKKAAEIAPRFGRLVIFLSGSIHHEVKFTKRERLSVTGWLKKRPAEPLL